MVKRKYISSWGNLYFFDKPRRKKLAQQIFFIVWCQALKQALALLLELHLRVNWI